jgi:transketolase
VSPAPEEDLRALLNRFPFAVTVESHYAVGGLGSLVCEVVAGNNIHCRVLRCGVTRNPAGEQGNRDFMHNLNGLSPERLAEIALENHRSKPGDAGADWIPRKSHEPSHLRP